MNHGVERRKYRRFTIKDGAIAVLKPFPIMMGEVVDIGMGGVALYYTGDEKKPDTYSEISLMCKDGVRVDEVLCKMVSDIEMDQMFSENPDLKVRRRSFQFQNLTSQQKTQLKEFIMNCAII